MPQERGKPDSSRPVELVAVDPEIRALLDENPPNCNQFSVDDVIEKVQKAIQIADSRGLIRDRALAEAMLASAYVGKADIYSASTAFQKALQDAIDSKNGVLEADILIALASRAQVTGNIQGAIELISKGLNISTKIGSLYEKSHALGELGKMMLFQGKTDAGMRSIDEALQIDKLNDYSLEARHLVYRGTYLGLAGKLDQAMDSLTLAKTKALSARDAYSFIMAENSYAFGLVKKGKADEAVADLELLERSNFQKFVQDPKEQACLASALELPVLHLTLLEGLANVLRAANQEEKELKIWQDTYSYSRDHGIPLGEAEAAHKTADLNNQLEKTDDALKYFAIAADLYRHLQNETLLAQVQVSQSLLLLKVGRGKEAVPLEQEVASFAKRHNLRSPEFIAYGVLAEIYQPGGELELARDALEKALSLVQPGPFDAEMDNHLVLGDYSRLSDIYRALKIPAKELLAIEKAFVTARELKDEKAQQRILTYLDQRLSELRIRELAGDSQNDSQLAESLLYSHILLVRDGVPSRPQDDTSNWNRVLTLPFQIVQQPRGAEILVKCLQELDSLVDVNKLPMLHALARYYISSGSDPALAERYALQSEMLLKDWKGDASSLRVTGQCVLAIAYSRQSKNVLAENRLAECLKLARDTDTKETKTFAEATNVMVHGGSASAKTSLQNLIAQAPENPELHVELAMSLANSKLYDDAVSQLNLAITKFTSVGDNKNAALAYVRVAIALNSDSSPKAQKLQLQYLREGQRIYNSLDAMADEARVLNAIGEYYIKLSNAKTAIEHFNKAYDLAQTANRADISAEAISNLGNAYRSERSFNKARDFHKKAVSAYRELDSPLQEVITLESLAEDFAAMNETDAALSSFLEAKRVAPRIPALNQYFLDIFLGEFYRKQGQFEKSLATFHEAVEITNHAGDLQHCAYSHLAIAELGSLIGGWEDAVTESEAANKLFQDIDDKKGQATAWAALTGIYSDRNSSLKDFDKAQKCYAKARELGYGEILQLDLRNCITFLPDRAICAHRDFVSGFCSRPRTSIPSNTKSTCRSLRLRVLRTG